MPQNDMNKEKPILLKKQWKKPELLIMLASVEGGNNPNVNESTARSSIGNPIGPGHPGQRAYNQFNSKFVADWTAAHS
jgi:hypothetical protein